MKTTLRILFIIFLSYSISYSQSVTWQKWYDYNNRENQGEDIIQTFDGGYLLLANNYIISNYSTNLIKLNFLGEVQWQRIIDKNTSGGDGLSCYSVQQTKDSGFVIAGYMIDSAILIRTYKDGFVKWIMKYSKANSQARFVDHKLTLDGGIIACGDIFPPNPTKGLVVKTDSLGNIEWDSIYNTRINTRIVQAQDSTYYFTGSEHITKIERFGRMIWNRSFPHIGADVFMYSVNDIYLSGGDGVMMYLTKIDSSGSNVWQKNYYPGSNGAFACLSKDNHILMVGFGDTLGMFTLIVVKTDLNGKEIFRKRINSFIGNYYMLPATVISTNDSGFMFTGVTDFPSSFYQDNAFATKTDSICNAPKFVGISNNSFSVKENFALHQNFPNPFNGMTIINFELFKPEVVELSLFDISGKKLFIIASGLRGAGSHKIIFDARKYGLATGMYLLNLSTHKNNFTNKIIYLK